MGHDGRVNVPTPQRWTDAGWRADALEWSMRALDRHGLAVKAWTQPHVRPWSTVLRLETDTGPVWLKANNDGTRTEAALLAALAHLDVPHTPRPLAVDPALGLTLLPDGGDTCRAHHGGRTPIEGREQLLVAYAQVQRATEPHTADLLATGVDDVRPGRMPQILRGLLDELEGAADGLDATAAARLRAVAPAYADACAELAEAGVAPALQHDDLHDNNVFHEGLVVFDWGDAVVGHPFGTLLTALRSIAHHHELASDDPVLQRLADSYLEAWTDVAELATLRRQAQLAIRVGPITRALAWRRALAGCDDASRAEWGSYPAEWLVEIDAGDLPLAPARLNP